MSHLVSRLGSAMVAVVVTAGLVVGSNPVEASVAGLKSRTLLRCTTRHNVRRCVRVTVHPTRRTIQRKPVAPAPRPKPATAPTTTIAPAGSLVAQEVALVNADRRAAGLPALAESAGLDRIASARAQDMAGNGYFSHYRPGHRTPAVLELLRANGVSFTWYGENIIWESGQPAASVASHVNTWWMNSPEHRANILNTHDRHIGIGVATIGSRVYVVEDFTN